MYNHYTYIYIYTRLYIYILIVNVKLTTGIFIFKVLEIAVSQFQKIWVPRIPMVDGKNISMELGVTVYPFSDTPRYDMIMI